VNVAARLEGLAEPGGICVSGRVQEDVEGKLEVTFENAGEQQLKNIARPVRVYRVRLSGAAPSSRPALPLPDKPSIAVLPFENMSGDPEQDYFADGIVEEIITALSRFRQLFVIARNSSFTYKGRAVDVKQVGRELGVRYILEGSVRKAGNRMRITGQLVDALTGAHLWADRFDGGLEDIFELQDSVTASVVGAIAPKIEQAEIERAKRKPTRSLDAYDYYLRGIPLFDGMTRETNEEALRLFNKALELDPDFALAYARAAQCYTLRKLNRWMTDPQQEVAEAARLARRALELGRDEAVALSLGGLVLAYVVGELDDGAAFVNRALGLNPNLAIAWGLSGLMKICLGEHNTAIEHAARAMRLSPLDPFLWAWQHYTALAHYFEGRYDEASSWVEAPLREQLSFMPALRLAAASNALAGRPEQAQKFMARLRHLDPALRLSNLADTMPPLRRSEDRQRWVEGLRKAGLPE
jgi:adenylate cyclase